MFVCIPQMMGYELSEDPCTTQCQTCKWYQTDHNKFGPYFTPLPAIPLVVEYIRGHCVCGYQTCMILIVEAYDYATYLPDGEHLAYSGWTVVRVWTEQCPEPGTRLVL